MIFWIGGRTTTLSYLMYIGSVILGSYKHIPDPSPFEVEITIVKLKRYKSPGSDQTPAEPIQAWGETLRSEVHKFINSIWNKKVWHDMWKKSIIVPVYKKGDKTDCSNYYGISLLSTSYKILSNIHFIQSSMQLFT
jgi:hypothetical protein